MLKLKEVEVGYNNKTLINNVNLEIEEGKLYILTGENGAGKTTLLKLLSGCIFSLSGEIFVDDIKIGYLPINPQYPMYMNSYRYLSLFSSVYKKEFKELANKYNLDNVLIHKLSKGNLVKLGLIQTLLCDFDLYLFDEVNDGLDIESKKILKEDIKSLLERNKTIIVSTHSHQLYKDLNPIRLSIKGGKLNEKKK